MLANMIVSKIYRQMLQCLYDYRENKPSQMSSLIEVWETLIEVWAHMQGLIKFWTWNVTEK